MLAGGRRRPDLGPLFYEPTILTGVTDQMQVYAEETFGPVVAVYPFDSESEAVERANATRYGLNASIWTRDTARGAAAGPTDPRRQRQRERILRRRLGIGGFALRRAKGIRPARAARCGRHPEIHRTQTVAVQRLLPVGTPSWMDAAVHARWMTRLLKLLRRIRVLDR